MDFDYSLDNEEQFWDELDDIIANPCGSHEAIDNALRQFLGFTTKFRDDYLYSDSAITHCIHKLLESPLFTVNKDYVRTQIVYCLLQEDDPSILHLISTLLLQDGMSHGPTFETMCDEGTFPRLLELIQSSTIRVDPLLHRTLLSLAYEMSRIQRLSWSDLTSVDDNFILFLFDLIEEVSEDAGDPYHYPVIRVLLVLNEQYMVYSTSTNGAHHGLPNRVLKAIAQHGHRHKTFGENLILVLNRESETSLQLLILKLLYLVFTSRATAEYFYTNDLHVLVDVILRNLLDLPPDADDDAPTGADAAGVGGGEQERSTPLTALRHTHLRVLHPLLANSQLGTSNYPKRAELVRLLRHLAGPEDDASPTTFRFFAPADPTTIRLSKRCLAVEWLDEAESRRSSLGGVRLSGDGRDGNGKEGGRGGREVARRAVGMSESSAGESAESVATVANQVEKPGVMTPRRVDLGGG